MTDRSTYGDLPRIPKPGELRLEIDHSLDQLRLYLIADGEYVTLAEIDLREFDSPEKINGACLAWGQDAAHSCDFVARGYRQITPILYSLEGPAMTRDRLTLIKDSGGYQLCDLSVNPPRELELGPQLLEDADMVQVAAQRARQAGYRPIGYRQESKGCWVLAEALTFLSPEKVAELLAAQDEPESWRERDDVQLAAIVTMAITLGAATVAAIDGVWWATSVAAVVASVSFLLVRPGRKTWHTWACEICQSEGLTLTARFRSAREARKALEEHMRVSHGQ